MNPFKEKALGYIPGVTAGRKDPTQCRQCQKKEPEIRIVMPRLCNLCRSENDRVRKATRRAEGGLK